MLGFCIAEIAAGFSRTYDKRKSQPIGWLAPLLAATLIVDLVSFWYGAWFLREAELKFWLALVAAIVGLIYFFAATQVFPRETSTLSNSDHVMAHRKPIVLAVIAANVIMFVPANVYNAVANTRSGVLTVGGAATLVYVALLVLVGWVPSKRWTGVAMIASILFTLGVALATDY
jgi:hypothetical protein